MRCGLLFSATGRIVEVTCQRSGMRPGRLAQVFVRRVCMNLTISGHHLEVTPALRGYVIQKLDRVMRHFDKVVDVRVLLSVEKQKEKQGRERAECNIHVKGSDLFAESASQDLYAAVDDLVDKLDRQVVRHKDRLQDHHHSSVKRELMN